FGLGIKGGAGLNSMFVPGMSFALGYEGGIFASLYVMDNLLLELDLIYEKRDEDFDANIINISGDDIIIESDLLGIQILGKYILDISGGGLNKSGSFGLSIPLGFRLNYHLQSRMTIDNNAYGFSENVSNISIDGLAGVGFIYYLNEKMDIFADLLFDINIAPAFYKPNFTTGDGTGSSSQVEGRYWGIKLGIGFTIWKF
ncbi:MAG: hypothetical protein ACOCV8_01900, partial [Spirochaetota bacterium]